MSADILIKNGFIVTVDKDRRVLENGAVVVERDKIIEVGKTPDIISKYSAEKVIDARGKMVLPGLVNTHDHLFQVLYRSLADDMELFEWAKIIHSLSEHLEEKDLYYSALTGCLEMIKSGATCVSDNPYVNLKPSFVGEVARGVLDAGMRGIVYRSTFDNPKMPGSPLLLEDLDKAVSESRRFVNEWNGKGEGRIRTGLGHGLPPWATHELIKRFRELATELKVPLCVHVAETRSEVEESMKTYRLRPVELMNSLNFLGPDVLCIHCVWLSDREIRILAAKDAKVSHNPTSNMYLASGASPIHRLLEAGITVGLGLDGAASNNGQDMVEAMKAAVLLNKVTTLDPTSMTAEGVLEMATIGGARALGIDQQVGSLEKGKKADIAIANLKNLATTPVNRPFSQLVYSANGSIMDTVLVDGKILMEGRKIIGLDEEEIIRKTQESADRLVDKCEKKGLRTRSWRSVAY